MDVDFYQITKALDSKTKEQSLNPIYKKIENELNEALEWVVAGFREMDEQMVIPKEEGGPGEIKKRRDWDLRKMKYDNKNVIYRLGAMMEDNYDAPVAMLNDIYYLSRFFRWVIDSEVQLSSNISVRAYYAASRLILTAGALYTNMIHNNRQMAHKTKRRKGKLDQQDSMDRQTALYEAADKILSKRKKKPSKNWLYIKVTEAMQKDFDAGRGPKPYGKTHAKKLLHEKYYNVVATT